MNNTNNHISSRVISDQAYLMSQKVFNPESYKRVTNIVNPIFESLSHIDAGAVQEAKTLFTISILKELEKNPTYKNIERFVLDHPLFKQMDEIQSKREFLCKKMVMKEDPDFEHQRDVYLKIPLSEDPKEQEFNRYLASPHMKAIAQKIDKDLVGEISYGNLVELCKSYKEAIQSAIIAIRVERGMSAEKATNIDGGDFLNGCVAVLALQKSTHFKKAMESFQPLLEKAFNEKVQNDPAYYTCGSFVQAAKYIAQKGNEEEAIRQWNQLFNPDISDLQLPK